MSVINGQSINALVSNNAWVSKNSYASDGDYVSAQSTYQVAFPDTSKAHIYYNSTLKLFRFHDGVNWNTLDKKPVISTGTSFPSSPGPGDIFVYSGNSIVVGTPSLVPNFAYYFNGTTWQELTQRFGKTEVWSTTGQVIANATAVDVIWNNFLDSSSSGGSVTVDTATGIMTPLKSGYYSIQHYIRFDTIAIGAVSFSARIYKNGVANKATHADVDRTATASAFGIVILGSTIVSLLTTDTFSIRVNQSTGASRSLFSGANDTYANIVYLGA